MIIFLSQVLIMWRSIFNWLRAFAILFAMFYLGKLIDFLLPIGIPASIWGLLLLFMGLVLTLIKPHWLFPATNLLIRYMALLFIPASVGVVEHLDLLTSQATSLLLPNIISTVLTIIFTALLAQRMFAREKLAKLCLKNNHKVRKIR